jgi:hypothetical protein
MKRGNFLLKKLGWMTSQVGWLERYWTNASNVEFKKLVTWGVREKKSRYK